MRRVFRLRFQMLRLMFLTQKQIFLLIRITFTNIKRNPRLALLTKPIFVPISLKPAIMALVHIAMKNPATFALNRVEFGRLGALPRIYVVARVQTVFEFRGLHVAV